MSNSNYDSLFDDLLEGVISDADFLKLEAEMIVDEKVRKAYYERLKLHTALQTEMGAEGSGSDAVSVAASPTSPGRALDKLLIGCLAALGILIGLLVWKMVEDRETYLSQQSDPIARGFGVLANTTSEAVWEGISIREGDLFPAGEVELSSGLVKLELFNGVDVVVNAPARVEVVSDFHLRVAEGKVLCRVPESLDGFHVEIPSGEIFDHGTEFEVEVTNDFESIDVLSGLVEWQGDAGDSAKIEAGHGLQRNGNGELQNRVSTVSPMSEIERGFEAAVKKRHGAWQKRLRALQNDSRVLALFSMEESDRVSAKVSDLSGSGNDGDIIRTERDTNRWGNPYGGIDFTPMGSRIRVQVEEELQSLSLMCWVKIDSLDRLYNSLFLTDGHELGEPHWQIQRDGRMVFSVKALQDGERRDKHIAASPVIWTPERSGQWMHLATVYDGAAHTITHYVNGSAVSIDQIPEDLYPETVKIGDASIGNWSKPRYRDTPEFRVRNLNGTMDEFILFSAALSAGDINELYESGKP